MQLIYKVKLKGPLTLSIIKKHVS